FQLKKFLSYSSMHIIIMGIFAKEKIFFQQTENELLQKIKFAVLYVIYYIYKNKIFGGNLWKIK
ncbi:hypothetical protein, partial [Treponema succinifaciens]|uniref:hypothetical protein n=1 Tax=Treponema succinifaciens TaxID=167 RepID=UPI0023EF6A25